jgi:hypothetical protein
MFQQVQFKLATLAIMDKPAEVVARMDVLLFTVPMPRFSYSKR